MKRKVRVFEKSENLHTPLGWVIKCVIIPMYNSELSFPEDIILRCSEEEAKFFEVGKEYEINFAAPPK